MKKLEKSIADYESAIHELAVFVADSLVKTPENWVYMRGARCVAPCVVIHKDGKLQITVDENLVHLCNARLTNQIDVDLIYAALYTHSTACIKELLAQG